MDNFIHKIISELPEKIMGTSATPSADHLFQVCTESRKLLSDQQAQYFCHTMAQLLFASTCVWRDVQTIVAFHTTCVKDPDEDDWGKLKRVLCYLNITWQMHLTLSVDSMSIVCWYWWITPNPCQLSWTHWSSHDTRWWHNLQLLLQTKTNTKSSTKTELVIIDD